MEIIKCLSRSVKYKVHRNLANNIDIKSHHPMALKMAKIACLMLLSKRLQLHACCCPQKAKMQQLLLPLKGQNTTIAIARKGQNCKPVVALKKGQCTKPIDAIKKAKRQACCCHQKTKTPSLLLPSKGQNIKHVDALKKANTKPVADLKKGQNYKHVVALKKVLTKSIAVALNKPNFQACSWPQKGKNTKPVVLFCLI